MQASWLSGKGWSWVHQCYISWVFLLELMAKVKRWSLDDNRCFQGHKLNEVHAGPLTWEWKIYLLTTDTLTDIHKTTSLYRLWISAAVGAVFFILFCLLRTKIKIYTTRLVRPTLSLDFCHTGRQWHWWTVKCFCLQNPKSRTVVDPLWHWKISGQFVTLSLLCTSYRLTFWEHTPVFQACIIINLDDRGCVMRIKFSMQIFIATWFLHASSDSFPTVTLCDASLIVFFKLILRNFVALKSDTQVSEG